LKYSLEIVFSETHKQSFVFENQQEFEMIRNAIFEVQQPFVPIKSAGSVVAIRVASIAYYTTRAIADD
jgi:hypothetical protein